MQHWVSCSNGKRLFLELQFIVLKGEMRASEKKVSLSLAIMCDKNETTNMYTIVSLRENFHYETKLACCRSCFLWPADWGVHWLCVAPRFLGPRCSQLRPPKRFATDEAFQSHVRIADIVTHCTIIFHVFLIVFFFFVCSHARFLIFYSVSFFFFFFLFLQHIFSLSYSLSSETRMPGSYHISDGPFKK